MSPKAKNPQFGEHLTVILKEMCRRVKVPFSRVPFKTDGWFRKHTWPKAEQHDFEEWVVNYLKLNSGARRELLDTTSNRSVRVLRKAASMFAFSYGWMLSD